MQAVTDGRAKIEYQIDEEDYQRLRKEKVRVYYIKRHNRLLAWTAGKELIFLSRWIMNCPKGLQVDHISGDTLDNRKENLRICSRSQNLLNSKKRKNTASKYKGVQKSSAKGKWECKCKLGYFGTFKTEEEAARKYNEVAELYYGPWARLNVIEETKQ